VFFVRRKAWQSRFYLEVKDDQQQPSRPVAQSW